MKGRGHDNNDDNEKRSVWSADDSGTGTGIVHCYSYLRLRWLLLPPKYNEYNVVPIRVGRAAVTWISTCGKV
jgi:hypothetical protein